MKVSPFRIWLVFGDVVATIAMFGSFAVRVDAFSYPERTIAPSSPPSVGALLRKLATNEERFYARHHHYARLTSELAVSLPDRWSATVLESSHRRYRIRLDTPVEDGRRRVCRVWGERRDPQTVEPFEIDCRNP